MDFPSFLLFLLLAIALIWLLFKRFFTDTSCPPSSSPHVNSEKALPRIQKYDVFINHRGVDVKDTLASHIYDLLDLRRVPAFLDREELETGDPFPDAITEAIASSTVHIAIFSPRYAESSWCLRELALMVKTAGATIIPVFFNVTPEEIRWANKGNFAKAFRKHYKRYPPHIVDEWKAALNKVSDLSGLPFSRFKGGLARKVVDEVMKRVSSTQTLFVAESPIGLDEHVNKLKEYIFQSRMEEKNVVCVGIIGMGGIGKSTLAKTLYNDICSNFSTSAYIEDVKGEVEKNGLKHIQQILLRQLLRYDFEVFNSSQGERMLREKLTRADALIVYDNIEYNYQMDDILFENVLNPGSTVVITTRDQSIFRRWNKNSYLKYELFGLNFLQSKELFCRHAFHSDRPSASFESLVDQFVNVCRGLPLALKVCGGELYNQSYEDCINFLKRASRKKLPELLRVSYEQLDEKQKEIFLDIAIFFHGETYQTITRIWEEEAEDFLNDFKILERKCMIKLDDNKVTMHDLFRELGRAIVDEECPKYPGRRSRLWRSSDVKEVLKNFTGTESVRGLSLVEGGTVLWDEDEFGNRCAWTTDSFANMKELQLLQLKDDCLKGDFGKLSQKLLFLRWRNFPNDHVPVDLHMQQTRILDLVGGKLVSLWNEQSQIPLKLRELNMNNCHFLNRVPESMARLTGLQKVDFSKCFLLNTVPEEFCYLEALEVLNLSYCCNLECLPLGIRGMKRLQSLDLTSCIKLKVLPESFGELLQLQCLEMEGCENVQIVEGSFGNISTLRKVNLLECGKLETMPSSLSRQRSLMDLRLGNSRNTLGTNYHVGFLLKKIPTSIGHLTSLSNLEINGCPELKEIPTTIGNLSSLSSLRISGCPELKEIPATIGNLSSLSSLNIYGCPKLKEISTTIGNLSNLLRLDISGCPELKDIPTTIGNLSNLLGLHISGCPELKEIPTTIGNLSSLSGLYISGFRELKEVPTTIGNLSSLSGLYISGCPELKEIPTTIGNLSSLSDLYISGCPELLKEIPTTIGSLSSLSNLEICLSNDTIFGLHQMKHHRWVEGLSPINHVHFTASAIPYANAIIDPSYAEATSPKSICQELKFEAPPSSERCSAVIICFVSVLFSDNFDRQCLPPQATLHVSLDDDIMYDLNFNQSKIGELINLIIFKSSKSIKVSVWPKGSGSSTRAYLKKEWMLRIKEGEEEMIEHICISFLKELRLQHLLLDAREHAPFQLKLRNVHALNITNCRIRRLCLLYDTPIQVEEMELVYRSKQLFWGNDKVLEHLDLSIVDTNLPPAIKSMANLYKMEVMISSRGEVVYKDELQEYDKDALVNRHDEISIQFFNILKSRELLKNELRGMRKGKKTKNKLRSKGSM